MLFELFITIYLQIQLLSKDIFPYCNSKFENNHKLTKQKDILYHNSESEYNTQKILRI
jgi:hypothetical protein